MKKNFIFLIFISFFMFSSCTAKKNITMIQILQLNIQISQTEITQSQFKKIMNKNPSHLKGANLPVTNVSWFDAVVFCNKMSLKYNLTPVYSVKGNTNPDDWAYNPCKGENFSETIKTNLEANGFRLPTNEEWSFAAMGEENYFYAGSSNIEEVAWIKKNSQEKPHKVALKKPNGYLLYDMSGNVWEWTNNLHLGNKRMFRGGSFKSIAMYHKVDGTVFFILPHYSDDDLGFRIVRNSLKQK